jgi:hypothetical protein
MPPNAQGKFATANSLWRTPPLNGCGAVARAILRGKTGLSAGGFRVKMTGLDWAKPVARHRKNLSGIGRGADSCKFRSPRVMAI